MYLIIIIIIVPSLPSDKINLWKLPVKTEYGIAIEMNKYMLTYSFKTMYTDYMPRCIW